MTHLYGTKVGEEVCKALGLDPSNITKLDILLHVSDAAMVEVTRYIESTELGKLIEVFEQYELKPKEGK